MEGNFLMSGTMAAKKIRPQRVGIGWKLKNSSNVWWGFWRFWLARALRIPTMYGELRARVTKASGEVIDYGLVSTKVVTTAFVTAMATWMYNGTGVDPVAYDYHACGTGSTAENASDTALVTDSGVARVSGTASNPGAGQYRSVGTMSFTGGLAIVEHGLFSASTGGTLLDRSVFSAINVVSGDSIQFTYTLTLSAGG